MTTPVIPQSQIIELPGVGDRIGQAIEPLLAMLKERREREQRQQQIFAQLGQLKLQQDEFAEQKRQQSEQEKGLKQAAQGLAQAAQQAGLPGELEGILQGAASGGPQAMISAMGAISNLEDVRKTKVATARQMEVRQKYAMLIRDQGKPLTQEQQQQFTFDMFQASNLEDEPGSISTVLSSQIAGSRPRTGQGPVRTIRGESIRQFRTQFPELGKGLAIDPTELYHVMFDPVTGQPQTVMGEAPSNFTDRLRMWGDVKQRDSSGFGLRLNNGLANIVNLTKDREDVRAEMEGAITAIETAGTLPLSLDDISQRLTQMFVNGQISEDGQIATNSMFDVLAARAQQGGGMVLPAHEWAIQVRSIAPLVGDKPKTFADKIDRLWKERERLLRQGGPATDMIRDLLTPFEWRPSGGPTPPTPPLDAMLENAAAALRARLRARTGQR